MMKFRSRWPSTTPVLPRKGLRDMSRVIRDLRIRGNISRLAVPDSHPGTRLGPYEITGPLGAGGRGTARATRSWGARWFGVDKGVSRRGAHGIPERV
jgi:hypothetical protein